MWPDLTLSG